MLIGYVVLIFLGPSFTICPGAQLLVISIFTSIEMAESTMNMARPTKALVYSIDGISPAVGM